MPEHLDFTVAVEVQREEMVDIEKNGIFRIHCTGCSNKVCHYPCDVSEKKNKTLFHF